MASPSKKLPAANAFTTSHTRLAACLVALGFPWQHRLRHRQRDSKDYLEFMFGACSQRPQFPGLTIDCARHFTSNQLELMHPLAVMMRALHNRNCLLEMHRGTPHRLVSIAGQMTQLTLGQEQALYLAMPEEVQINDLDLAAALACVGIAPVKISGADPRHLYHLPKNGVLLKKGRQPYIHSTRHLIRRAPTAADPLHLALEDEEPLHPVVLAYDALTVRAELQALVRKTVPSILIEERGMIAEVSANFTGRVMDRIAARLGTVAP